jgi:hypothetical protein
VAALVVGSVLFMVNLYSQVRHGPFTWVLASRVALTFLVPWLNATMGIAIGLRRPALHRAAGPRPQTRTLRAVPPGPQPEPGRSPAGPVER